MKLKCGGNRMSGVAATAVLLLLLTGCAEVFNPRADVTINGVAYPYDTAMFAVSDSDFSEFDKLKKFKYLKRLDITPLDLTAAQVDALQEELGGDVDIVWTVPFRGERIPSTTRQLEIPERLSAEDIRCVGYFNDLRQVTIAKYPLSDDLMTIVQTIRDVNPQCMVECATSVYGADVDNGTRLLILNDRRVGDLTELKRAFELFPNIASVEMCGCGVSNGQMDELREEYPAVRFVWDIRFLDYSVRTDAQCFSTLVTAINRRGTSEDFAPLFRYCTELRALDLGHQGLTDISGIRSLTKLQTLILADNYITDISPLADLPELNFVELFQNDIQDISPLADKANLEDLNIMYNGNLQNITLLARCGTLDRLYIAHCGAETEDIHALRDALPGCEINTTANNCVYDGWRVPRKARYVREAFRRWQEVSEYRRWDDILYSQE